ncbi:hypothetical protein F2Q68_00012736 [Brassica cretica]|uniref:NAC domain-containing protein n=1 Tax=Brassica cretica TaxID=69181 RepID=A0A8S9HHV1_BRACR|nr:hypothetical protein F2Q68_00012736 [Brassica cretica]
MWVLKLSLKKMSGLIGFSPATLPHLSFFRSEESNMRMDPETLRNRAVLPGESETTHRDSNASREQTDTEAQGENNNVFQTKKRRRALWKASVYSMTLGMLISLLMGLNMSWTAITAALALVVLDFKDARPSLQKAKILQAKGTTVLALVILVLSNVPTVLPLGARVAAAAGEEEKKAWNHKMVDPVGYRFRPTDEEIVGHYVRPKSLESNTSHVDEVMNTVDIYSFDPWELRCKSRIKSRDEVVWYFFGCKKRMHNSKHRRTIPSGFWSNTGKTKPIIRKKGGGDHEKIGEKRVFVFKYSSKIPGGSKSKSKSKSDWVMHEYVATFSSPDSQMMTTSTYTVCKVMFKGDPTDLPSSSSAGEIEDDLSLIPQFNSNCSGGLSNETEVQNPNQITSSVPLIPHVNNSSEGLSTEAEVDQYRDRGGRSHQITSSISLIPRVNNNNSGGKSTETEVDPRLFSGFLYLEEDAHFEDETLRDLNYDGAKEEEEEELVNLWSTQGNRNDHRPKMPLTGFISDDDDDDSDSDSISTKTCSIKSSSTCVTFGSSNRLIDQIIDLPDSPRSTIESVSLTQEVSNALGANSAISEKKMSPCDDDAQVSEIGGDQMGQEKVIKHKRAGFIYRMIQKFAKKIKLCSCVSRI